MINCPKSFTPFIMMTCVSIIIGDLEPIYGNDLVEGEAMADGHAKESPSPRTSKSPTSG